MFRRIFALTVLGCVLAAGPAAAQNQGYSVWAHRFDFSGGGSRQAENGYFETPATYTPLAATRTASIEVRLPNPQAQVSFDGQTTATRGRERLYETPALQVGKNYHYNVTATWMENGRQIQRNLQVGVNAGRLAVVDFTRPVLAATRVVEERDHEHETTRKLGLAGSPQL